jgi:hypothetical protein
MSTTSQPEPKFPPNIFFCNVTDCRFPDKPRYLIDGETIRDILAAMDCKTASQAYRRAKLFEILEQETNELS